ncbi:MAG: phosphatidate cytidylyltransferase, partial [Solirubrobacterales bacterium]
MESGEQEGRRRGRFDDADRIFGDDTRAVEPIFGDDPDSLEMEPFAPEAPPQPQPEPRRRRGPSGETLKRVLVAIPWIVFAIVITALGGVVFMAAMVLLAVIGLREFFVMARGVRPVQAAGFAAVPAMIVAAHFGDSYQVLMVAAASFGLLFAFGAGRESREGVTMSIAITLLGVFWIGIPLVHAVLLRDLPDHGGALLIDVLVGTFATDTAAYATGRLFGSRRITPRLSPNKTLEGLIGGFVIGTMAFWFAGLYQDWLSGTDALIMG